MRRVSSRLTFALKRIFPAIWIALTLWMAAVNLLGPDVGAPLFERLFPFAISLSGLAFLMFESIGLMDEILDCGGHLMVRQGGVTEHIAIASIINVNFQPRGAFSRITLRLDRASRFGSDIAFLPTEKFSFNPSTSALADELIARADRARRMKARAE